MAPQHRVPVILTRPLAQSKRFARDLPSAAEPVFSPLLRIKPLDVPVDWQAYDGFAFTSENGVNAIPNPDRLRGRRAYCVGDRTAETARAAGFEAVSAGGTAEDLVALIAEDTPGGRLLHVHGAHVRVDLAKRLAMTGVGIDGVTLYDQVAQPLTAEAGKILQTGHAIVPLFSPRTAGLFFAACPEAPRVEVICISAAVAAELAKGRYGEVKTAAEPNGTAILNEISCRVPG